MLVEGKMVEEEEITMKIENADDERKIESNDGWIRIS